MESKRMDNDIALLNLIRKSNELAFKQLFDAYFVPLCRYMHLYIKDKAVCEGHALDIFTYVWENRMTLSIQLSFKAYLFQSARNKCLNTLRQNKRTVSIDDLAAIEVEETEEMSLEIEELSLLIQEAVMALPNRCKDIFQLSRKENLSNQEIAIQLNISIKTVEAQISKALKRIKEYLGETYYYLW